MRPCQRDDFLPIAETPGTLYRDLTSVLQYVEGKEPTTYH